MQRAATGTGRAPTAYTFCKKFQGGQLSPTALKCVADFPSVMSSSHYRLLLPHSRHSVESSGPTMRKNVFSGERGMVIM